jgi:EAL and modified HD-GYP domain-containing signal transduction protein
VDFVTGVHPAAGAPIYLACMHAIQLEAAPDEAPQFHLGRQPILDREGRTVAYELLFRPSARNGVHVTDDRAATAAVIAHAFSDLGIEAALGGCQGFINFDAALLHSEVPELLPASSIVIEILETVEITPELLARCRELKQKGFRFALDDVMRPEEISAEVLELIDIVKVDLAIAHPDAVPAIALAGQAAGVKLLAEKVDSLFLADRCKELGFDLFQGYYFARPMLLGGRRTDPHRQVLLQLLQQVAANAPRDEIEQTFKHAPELTYKLMRLVNSVGMGVPNRIQSLAHALVVLGERQLHRWLQVLMFAHQDTGGASTALMTLAATRGRLMELIAEHCPDYADLRDQAFMTGIMSLLDTLLDVPMDELLQQVNLGLPIHEALLVRHGRLGDMLSLVEALEKKDSRALPYILGEDSVWPVDELPALQVQAMTWANDLAVARG